MDADDAAEEEEEEEEEEEGEGEEQEEQEERGGARSFVKTLKENLAWRHGDEDFFSFKCHRWRVSPTHIRCVRHYVITPFVIT